MALKRRSAVIEAAFIEAFRHGGDIHRETAALIFGVAVQDVTPEMRARAKTINFATIYGQGAFALAKQLMIPQDEASRFIAQYFERFAGVRAFLDRFGFDYEFVSSSERYNSGAFDDALRQGLRQPTAVTARGARE